MDARRALLLGITLMLLAVVVGAFGAHALEERMVANGKLTVFETASDYHFYHALGLLIIGGLSEKLNTGVAFNWAVYFLFFGVLVFCGSLYLLSIFNLTWLGMLTPIGGLFLIGGWVCLLCCVASR